MFLRRESSKLHVAGLSDDRIVVTAYFSKIIKASTRNNERAACQGDMESGQEFDEVRVGQGGSWRGGDVMSKSVGEEYR